MKRLKTIINIIIWTLVAIYIAVITLTNIPAVQTFIGKEIAGVIAAKLHTNVSISRVDVGFLNRIIIDGVRIDDLRGKKMFQATRLAAKISLTDLANGRVAVSSAQVFGMDTYLYRDSAGQPLNIQFVLDALASKDTTSHKPLDIEIGSLVVRHGKLRYDQLDSHDYKLTSLRHLSLGDISAHIVVNKLTDDSLNINIKKLAFKESSGLRLDDFKMKLAANRSAAHVHKLQLIMPGTNIQTDELSATYSFDKGRLMLPSLQYRLAISNTIISPSDFSPLLQQLSSLDRKLQLKARLYGTSTSMSLENFSLSTTDGDARMSLTGALTKGFRNPAWHIVLEQLTATSSILSDIAASISSDDKTRQLAAKVGTLSISGTAGGAKRQMSLTGKVSSDIGDANLRAGLNGDNMSFELDAEDINLLEILTDEHFGKVSANVKGNGCIARGKESITAKGLVSKFDYNKYCYRGISLDGQYRQGTFSGTLACDDPNASFDVSGTLSRTLAKADIIANIHHLRPSALKLTDRWGEADFSATVTANATGDSPANALGTISMERFAMSTTDDNGNTDVYTISNVNLSARKAEGRRILALESDFAYLKVKGDFDFQSLSHHLCNIIASKLPSIQQFTPIRQAAARDSRLEITAQVRDTEPLRHLLGIPLTLHSPLSLYGNMDSRSQHLTLAATLPSFSYDGNQWTDASLFITTPADTLKAEVKAHKLLSKRHGADYSIRLAAADDNMQTNFAFDNNSSMRLKGLLNANTRFATAISGKAQAIVDILPSEIHLADTTWNIGRATITYSNKQLAVDNFSIAHADQHIRINGRATDNHTDSLLIDLNKVDVAYILNLVNFHSVDFGGKASGKAYATALFGKPAAAAKLQVDGFTFENGRMGTLLADVEWNNGEGQIDIAAKATDEDNRNTIINGYVSPRKNYIDLDIVANNTRGEFMESFCGSFMDRCDLSANGNLRLWGPLNAIELTGRARVDGKVHISSLNTEYTLTNDSLLLLPGEIRFVGDTITDRYGNTGIITGSLNHQHLSRLTYDINVRTNNLLVYDFDGSDGSSFYGTAYGTGLCSIRGRSGLVVMDIDITPNQGSIVTYNVASPDAIKSQEFITWKDRDSIAASVGNTPIDTDAKPADIPSDIHINFLIHTQPSATLRLIMDQTSGDYIDLNGSGVIRATYYNKGNFDLFGNYLVEGGVYKLTIQNALHKEFQFLSGGTIAFGGNPYDATLNLKAMYPLNSVSLSDLQLGRSFTSNNIKVNCLMNISGTPNAPKVEFGLDLPTVSSDAKQMIYSLINSEEEMNQQVLYLLAVGRFYSQGNNNSATGGTGQSQTSLAMQSILSGQVSQQINSLLGTIINNSNWNFGANISTGDEGWNNAEYEGLLSGRLLNNRLLINGEFGYRDNPNATTSFIGDFDIRYLLLPNGNLAVRVYNQSNDRYFTRNSLNTQGLGFILKKDFNSLRDLLGMPAANNSAPSASKP